MTHKVNQSDIKLEDFLSEVGFGEVRIVVVDRKFSVIPRQRIERPSKHGIRAEFVIDEPIRLRHS